VRIDSPQSDPNDPTEAALDRLLAQARWEEPSAESRTRLVEQWTALSRKRQSRWRIGLGLAAAAAIAIAFGIAALRLTRPRPIDVAIESIKPVTYLSINPAPMETQSRPANLAEQLALMQLAGTPKPAPRPVAEERPQPDPVLEGLFAKLNASTIAERFAAARELADAAVGQPQVVARLTTMVKDDKNRREALLALRISDSAEAAQALAGLPVSRTSQEQLAADTRAIPPGL
jgi:hypothetical protein